MDSVSVEQREGAEIAFITLDGKSENHLSYL